jgi:hypothetical protein
MVPPDALTPGERRRLFIETAAGLEPAAWWLRVAGPHPHRQQQG